MWEGLTELTELWLNFNHITAVWGNAFANLPLLERLVLNDNALTTLESNAFSPLDTPGVGHPTNLVLTVSTCYCYWTLISSVITRGNKVKV